MDVDKLYELMYLPNDAASKPSHGKRTVKLEASTSRLKASSER